MVFDERVFVSLNPFNVYVAQPEVYYPPAHHTLNSLRLEALTLTPPRPPQVTYFSDIRLRVAVRMCASS